MIKFRKHTLLFIAIDFLAAMGVWFGFYAYRKFFIEPFKFGYAIPFEADSNLYLGLLAVPVYWVVLYALSGTYMDVWRKSRIREISNTFSITAFGVVILFFGLLLDDEVNSYQGYYKTVITLFCMQFAVTACCRILMATYIKSRINAQQIGFKTIVAGNSQMARRLVDELQAASQKQGYLLTGFVSSNGEQGNMPNGSFRNFGTYSELPGLIRQHKIEEVIIALEPSRQAEIIEVTNVLEDEPVILKIVPNVLDVVSGTVKMQNVLGTALIEINHQIMPTWQKVIKRGLDILVSLVILVILSPVYLVLCVAVRLSSPGPVFYKQTRIGLHGKPFKIIKYRTMYMDAEAQGPALSSKDDKRITNLGKVLRKYRLDEIPQFYNVLVGDMSLVGPRPERQFFIDQIMRVAPHYKHLQRVRPGITSWGMVKYGYAENIDQMVERLNFDIIYIENMTLAMDFRIMIYTVKTIVQGRGK